MWILSIQMLLIPLSKERNGGSQCQKICMSFLMNLPVPRPAQKKLLLLITTMMWSYGTYICYHNLGKFQLESVHSYCDILPQLELRPRTGSLEIWLGLGVRRIKARLELWLDAKKALILGSKGLGSSSIQFWKFRLGPTYRGGTESNFLRLRLVSLIWKKARARLELDNWKLGLDSVLKIYARSQSCIR